MQCPSGRGLGDSDGHSGLVSTAGKGQGVDEREHERHMIKTVCVKNRRASITILTQRIPLLSCCVHTNTNALDTRPGCLLCVSAGRREGNVTLCLAFGAGGVTVINVFCSGSLHTDAASVCKK